MLESLQLFALGGRQARTLPGITLRLADPSAERFDPAAQFLGDRSNRGPLRRMLGGVVEDHPDCTLTQLRGVLTGASHGLHPLSEWALRQTRYDSRPRERGVGSRQNTHLQGTCHNTKTIVRRPCSPSCEACQGVVSALISTRNLDAVASPQVGRQLPPVSANLRSLNLCGRSAPVVITPLCGCSRLPMGHPVDCPVGLW